MSSTLHSTSTSRPTSAASSTIHSPDFNQLTVPGRLWRSHASYDTPSDTPTPNAELDVELHQSAAMNFEDAGLHPPNPPDTQPIDDRQAAQLPAQISQPALDRPALNPRTRLLRQQDTDCGSSNCDHGTFTPRSEERPGTSRAGSIVSYDGKNVNGADSDAQGDADTGGYVGSRLARRALVKMLGPGVFDRRKSTTQLLAQKHGIDDSWKMYITYYIPFANWILQYRWSFLKGDVIAALTMASFYIPMALSYASNLGHVPPINGLYSFVFNPLVYAFLGTCPQMVVGPEAAGSLLLGNVVRMSVERGHIGEDDSAMNARVAGVVTGMAGATILIAGILRLGFIDSVLSRPFLRGFISAIGFVILVDQLIPETGLLQEARNAEITHGSSIDKLGFLLTHLGSAHPLTCAVSFGSFAIIMVCREVKKRLQPRYPGVAYIPDRFIVVFLSAVLTGVYRWDKQGLEVLGEVKSATGSAFPFQFPIIPSHMKHVREAMSTSFIIALLGFFESSVAAKSLGDGGKSSESIQGMALSANRELVALGVANCIGGCFMALPAFGGYGRSKVNKSTGGQTPMSSIVLSLISIICVLYLVPYFYYLPGVLSAMVSVVAYSLIEECPEDIKFFWGIKGWTELGLMALIFAATIFYSLPLGIALGLGFSVLAVIKHATKPRIQILGKVPGETNHFENAEGDDHQRLEFFDDCLIVKIPEPLTFANTGALKNRLRRLEMYGTNAAHPALPQVRTAENNRNLIFDIHGVTSLDGSGAQVLSEIVTTHVESGGRVYFCRIPSKSSTTWQRLVLSGIVEECGGMAHFTRTVQEALELSEAHNRDGDDRYRDELEAIGPV